jgi:glycosyltransferase involved in cell wall biosynthesis
MVRELLAPAVRVARVARAHARGFGAYLAGAPAHGKVCVSYGIDVPRSDEPAVGGIVKLQQLARAFPDDRRRFNVLYLVSSRLPDGAVALADWAHRKGARVVLNQNGVAYPAWYGDGWERVNAPMAALLARADHVFYQSAFCRQSADRFVGPSRGNDEVLYNAVDTDRFAPAQKREARRALTLLLGGSQDQWYRFESAVRALVLLVAGGLDAELVVTGRLGWKTHGAARAEAQRLIEQLGLNGRVELIGPYSQRDAPAIFNRADVVLHTKYNDPCPTVVVEALACGRPVVYSNSGGVPELVGTDAGIGVGTEQTWDRDVPPSPEALAEATARVQQRWSTYAAAARRRAVERFDVQRWLTRHRQVFEALVA